MIRYHIFTNNCDEWTNSLSEATAIFNEFAKDCGCARLYEETWSDINNDEPDTEDCIKSVGEWPL